MKLLNDKKGFLDTEVLMSLGFIILFLFAAVATLLGYVWSKKQGWVALPIWQLFIILGGEFFVAYYFASRD